MEEKRKDVWTPPAATTSGEIHSFETPVNPRRRGGGLKRKLGSFNGGNSSTPPTASSKRQAREKQEAIPFPPIHNYPVTRARVQPSSSTSAAAAASPSEVRIEESDVAIKEADRIEEVKGEQELNETEKVDLEDLEANIETAIEAIRTRDANVHVVPNHAGWFSWDKVHSLEEKTLPSFFDGKFENRNPDMYLEIRNWIMKKFHANPNIRIEQSDLAEIEVGDMEARQVVMDFLDYWGLINYHPFPTIDTTIAGDVGEAENADSLLKSLFHFESDDSCMPVIPRNSVSKPAVPSGLFPESAITEDLVKSEGPSVEYHCNSCSADCSRKRYHCQKQADFDLCPECFNNGMFGSDMSPSDFILMEPAESGGASSGKWTDQETLLLLEALELFNENWNEIAEHVATKTKAQCILHFVQMPIEDVFFDNGNETESTSKEHVDTAITTDDKNAPKAAAEVTGETKDLDDNQPSSLEKLKPEEVGDSHISKESENLVMKALNEAFEDVGLLSSSSGHLSFAEAANPVMTLAAFLVNLVDPNIATVSVRNSLKLLSRSSAGEQLALRNCFCLENPPDEEKSTLSERIDTEMAERETEKDEDENIEKKSDMDVDSLSVSNDENNNSSKDPAMKEDKASSSSPVNVEVVDRTDKSSSDTNACKVPEPENLKEPDNADKSSKKGPVISDNLTMDVEVPPGFEREPVDSAILVKPSESTDVPVSSLKNKDPLPAATSNSTDENGANKEPEDENGKLKTNPEDENGKLKTNPEDENGKLKTNIDGEYRINKIRNAAVATISALSVKAKLFANKEEEQIRQLAALLIDRQLNKLEMKLSYLSEMENLVMRVREQVERSKMRLFHERAQIIAARMSGSGPRPTQQPANRSAMGMSAPPHRPPSFIGMSGGGQRPQLVSSSRPNIMMSSNPPSHHHHQQQDQQQQVSSSVSSK